MSDLPFETLTVPANEAEGFIGAFDRPGHVALLVGPWVREEFAEFVDDFTEPAQIIAAAREVNVTRWIAERVAAEAHFASAFGGIFQAIFGTQAGPPAPDASDAEKYIHAARASVDPENAEKSAYVRDLEEVLNDAAAAMRAPGDQLEAVVNVMERLQALNDRNRPLDETIQGLQTIGQFFMGEQIAKMTGMDEMTAAFATPPEPGGSAVGEMYPTDTADTFIAVLPIDDAWAALAWMQQGSYAQGSPPALLAVARDLEKRFGARVVLATSDSLGFQLSKPVADAEAVVAAFQALGATTINDVEVPHAASHLKDATQWLVWWD